MKKFIDKKVLLISGIVFSFLFVLVIGSFLLKGKEPISTEVEEHYHRTEEIVENNSSIGGTQMENKQPITEKDKKISGKFSLNYKGVNGYQDIDAASITIKAM